MQASHHIGKVVVTFAPEFDPLGAPLTEMPPIAKSDATYLVTGGFSGLGLRTAWWLVRHGARHLALLSRRGAAGTPGADSILELSLPLRAYPSPRPPCDVADAAAVRRYARLDRSAHAAAARHRTRGDGDRGRTALRPGARPIASRIWRRRSAARCSCTRRHALMRSIFSSCIPRPRRCSAIPARPRTSPPMWRSRRSRPNAGRSACR